MNAKSSNKLYILAGMLIAGLLPMQASAYTTTTTMNVSLEVQPVPPNVTVSPLDFGVWTNQSSLSAQTDLIITATPGMAYTVEADFGQNPSGASRFMLHSGGVSTFFYDLFNDAAHTPITTAGTSTPLFSGTATATAATHTIYAVAVPPGGTPLPDAYGFYNDVVTLTISY
ncbi:MAG: hypothetical protein CO187_03685 [Zetaproteobacteria bacterium CG_4_9_14_3_um_filter_53_7]|nr:MAG: hypothetical protein CO187_03685 [Zetaproteobacteria bacterium CG_4_9_14_3_um_filter_53_7]